METLEESNKNLNEKMKALENKTKQDMEVLKNLNYGTNQQIVVLQEQWKESNNLCKLILCNNQQQQHNSPHVHPVIPQNYNVSHPQQQNLPYHQRPTPQYNNNNLYLRPQVQGLELQRNSREIYSTIRPEAQFNNW